LRTTFHWYDLRNNSIEEEKGKKELTQDKIDERRSNILDAFTCVDRRLSEKQVVLLDDVCTSGATLEACAAALKSAGAFSVWGLTLARET